MSLESGMMASLNGNLKAHSQKRDEKGVINLYGELLRLACSLGEMLEGVGRHQSKTKNGNITPITNSRTGCDGIVDKINLGIAVKSENSPGSELNIAKLGDMHGSTGTG